MVASHVLRGYYVDPKAPPATPLSKDKVPATRKIDDMVIALANSYGWPIGYAQEQSGRLIHNLFPIKSSETEQISSSSKVELQLHTETAFHPYLPDYVVLYCVRGDPAAATTYAVLDDILSYLDTSHVNILRQRRFTTSVDLSFRTKGEPDQIVFTEIISATERGPRLKYDHQLMRGIDLEAQRALDQLSDAISKSTRLVVLEAGDALIINNHDTVHGRTRFTPRYDGTDRWLKRALVLRNLPMEAKGGVISTTHFGTILPQIGHPHRYKDTSSQLIQGSLQ
jgi:hypothetical protein